MTGLPTRIGVTGANGLVGRALCTHLQAEGHTVVALSRRDPGLNGVGWRAVGAIDGQTQWAEALAGLQAVVHCAAHAHQIGPQADTGPDTYFRVNTDGTYALVSAAHAAGVKRLVFVSSVKAMGEATAPGERWHAQTEPHPEDAYGRSKWAAEQALAAWRDQIEVVIVRPPLVYGPGVGANFARFMRAVQRGWPLPLGAIHNRRAMVGLGNLTNLLALCVVHPYAPGQTFLISDGQDLSTPDWARAIGRAAGRPARLLSVPPAWLRWAGALTGRREAVRRLTDSLSLDIGHTQVTLGWQAPHTIDDGLRAALAHPKP
jgi:nucleoside-diphosphate-sugar epimerase